MREAEKLDALRTRTSLTDRASETGAVDCGTAVLVDFGVTPRPGDRRLSMNDIRERLEAAGRTVEMLWARWDAMSCPTLAQFIRERPDGEWVLLTGLTGTPHSMAWRDGELTDTDLTGTRRRRINCAYRVS